jgi:NAD(P)-dependent dehydrogenase (short-subunit alcohol dehydrogenase family)
MLTSQGIGLMIARSLLSGGASKVYILGRRQEALDTACTQNLGLIPIQCDITSKASLQAAVDHITQDVGYINLLIANSGSLGPTATFVPGQSVSELRKSMFEDSSMDEFNHVFMVNTTATYFSMLAFLELLAAGNKHALSSPAHFGAPLKESSDVPSIQSQIVVTSSVGAFLREWMCAPAYAGSKAAIVHLVKQTSSGLAAHGIRVNALAPGCVSPFSPPSYLLPLPSSTFSALSRIAAPLTPTGFPSEMADAVINSRDPGTEDSSNPAFIPARRFGGEEEMAGTVLYLASRAGSFCNGLVLVNDGGRLGVTQSTY